METYSRSDLEKKLTRKQRIFCHEYIIDWNGSRAARVAKYSPKSCRQVAAENLTKPYIMQYIELIKHDYEKNCGISKTKQINELMKIAYSSIAHLHNTWIELKEFEKLSDDQKESIESIETKSETKITDNGHNIVTKYVKLKLYSKNQALEQINKMMGYNEPKKIELSGEIQTPNFIVQSQETADEMKRLTDHGADD